MRRDGFAPYRIGESYRIMRCIGCSTENPVSKSGETRVLGSTVGLTWEQEHLSFVNDDILELLPIHDFQQHRTLVLIEPLRRLIDVVVCPGVPRGSTDDLVDTVRAFRLCSRSVAVIWYHDGETFVIDAVVIDRRLEEVAVLLQ